MFIEKKSHFKKIIALITLLLLSCFNNPDFFIESLLVSFNDKRLGNQVELKSADYGWMLDLLL